MEKYKFRDLISGIENLPESLLNYNSILYRIHDNLNDKNYIGTAKYGLPGRLYDGFHGHVILYRANNLYKCRGMYHNMNLNLDAFDLIIEDTDSPNNYDRILQRETELIKFYDSVIFGYNVAIDGKPGWKDGSICVNDGTYDIYVYQEDLEHFLQNGFSLGSCKHDFLKGTIWVNDGIISKMIDPSDFKLYQELGYVRGNLNQPNNSGKVWVNNGITSRLIEKSLLTSKEFSEFTNFGRIEPPRKKRGKYSAPKKNIVNDGDKEIRIPVSEIQEFLAKNPQFKRGRLKIK